MTYFFTFYETTCVGLHFYLGSITLLNRYANTKPRTPSEVLPKIFCSQTPFGFEKTTKNPHILVMYAYI